MTRIESSGAARGRRGAALWALKALVAAVFLLAAGAQLSAQPMMVSEFQALGFGQGFRIFTGVVELVGGLLLLWPGTAFFGALVLLGVCVGAFAVQVKMHGDLVHVVVLAALVSLAAWAQRPGAPRRSA